MGYQNIFERYEIKYLLTKEQKNIIMSAMDGRMKGDQYGRSTICNIYFDLPDHYLIRRSLEHPVYKEKLRVRSYGTPTDDSSVFVELKKKYKSVVYKRRISMTEREAKDYLCGGGEVSHPSQISREIDYFCSFYKGIQPAMFLSYDREAFYGVDDDSFRVTFDENIHWRDYDLSLTKGVYGNLLLLPNQTLMEVKTSGAIPLWMVSAMTECHAYKASFSKYGTAFTQMEKMKKMNA